jgi:hypothetical protein
MTEDVSKPMEISTCLQTATFLPVSIFFPTKKKILFSFFCFEKINCPLDNLFIVLFVCLFSANHIGYFLGRTSVLVNGYDNDGRSSYGLPTTQDNPCPELQISNVIHDISPLRHLTDDLQLGTNQAWDAVQHLFSYDHDATNPRDFSRCMFRCWNGRDGSFRETFVWGARRE